ncbi:MAG: T9SS type A sorting domain-containing protein [Bacteroidales bacterium]|nr:T9SS type A sorting domain-containing protein [Bacteroidales bacterium]
MKNKLVGFFLIFSKIVLGQITITQNHLPTVNDTIHYKTGMINNFDPNATGTNYTWDFSTVNPNNQRADTIISVTQTPIVYNVVFNMLIANQAYINQTPPSLGTGLEVSEYYDFFKKANNYYRKAGFGATINGVQTPVKYDNPELYFKLPLTYGTTDSSVSKYGLPIPGYGYYGQTIKRKHIADGWGTIITPFGSYPCIRVKHIIDIKDTVYSESLNFGYTITRPTSYEYYWLTNANIRAFAAKVYRNGLFYTIDLYYNPITSTEIKLTKNMLVYPNPAKEFLYVSNITDLTTLTLYNSWGQKIYEYVLSENTNTIDIANMPSGLYYIQLTSKKESCILKILINP